MTRNTKDNYIVISLLFISIAMIMTICSSDVIQNENNFEMIEIQASLAE